MNHKNFSQATLAAAITTTTGTSITVSSSATFPAAPFIISIDTEAMLVTVVSGTTWTVTRGYEGSTAATHLNGAIIYHDISAAETDSIALKAPLASPALSGTPTAPTAAVDTATTQIATTAMVVAQAAAATPVVNGVAAVGTSKRYARADHVHPTDTSRQAFSISGMSGVLGQNAVQTIVSGAGGGYLVYVLFNGNGSTSARGAWFVTIQADSSVIAMGTPAGCDCVVSGNNIQIKNTLAGSVQLKWAAVQIY